MKNSQKKLWLYLLVPVLPLLWLLIDQSSLYLFRDISLVFLPAKKFWADSVLQFHSIPGWNPYLYGGIPFIADMNLAPLHPLNFLFLLFPLYSAFILFLLLQVLAFSFGSYWMFREYKLGRVGSILAALSLSLSAFYFSTFSLAHVFSSITSIPFFLVALKHLGKKPSLRWWSALAFFIAWPIYAGDPQVSYGMGLVAIYSAFTFLFAKKWKSFFYLVCSLICAGGLSFAQILPALGIVAESERGLGKMSLEAAQIYSFHPIRVLEFFLSLPFGNVNGEYWGSRFLPDSTVVPFFFHVYAGAFIGFAFCVLVIRTLLKNRKRGKELLSALMLVILASFGSYLLINFYHLLFIFFPGWNLFRFPERWLVAFIFLLFLYLAPAFRWLGIKYLTKGKEKRGEKYIFPSLFILALGFFLVSFLFEKIEVISLSRSASHLFFISGLFFALFFFRKKIKSTFLLQSLLCLIFVVDLFPISASILWRIPKAHLALENNLIADKIKAYKASHETDFQTGAARRYFHGTYVSLPSSPSLSPIMAGTASDWLSLYPNISMLFQIESAMGYDSFDPEKILKLWSGYGKKNAKRFLDLFSVAFFPARAADGSAEVRLNPNSAPMIFTPQKLWYLSKQEAAEAKLFSAEFKPNEEAVFMGAEEEQNQTAWQIVSYTRNPDYMRAELRDWNGSAEKITVVWNERFNKNWKAYFNGNLIPVLQANLWAMAIESKVPSAQGVQVLEFRYEDESFLLGKKLSGFCLLFLLFLFAIPVRAVPKKK